MSSRKYPSGCVKRKLKEKRESEKNKIRLMDNFIVRETNVTEKKTTPSPSHQVELEEVHVDSCENNGDITCENEVLENTEPNVASSSTVARKEDLAITAKTDLLITFENDPALWTAPIQKLREHFVWNKPDQNISALKDSGRMFGNKLRTCTQNHFYRKKRNGELLERDWLVYSSSANALFCYVCKLFSRNNDALCTTGFTDWQNISARIGSHETSFSHRQAVNSLSQMMLKSNRIDSKLLEQNENEKMYWKNVLLRVFEVIKFISQRGLSIFGNNETVGSVQNGNFLGILELVSKFDPFLAEHLNSHANKGQGHVNYLSSSTVNDMIQIMADIVLKQIVSEIHESQYFGVIVDSTPDITHTDQLCIVIRYVESKTNEPVERFLKFVPIQSHAAEHLYDTLKAFFKKIGIELKYCRGQSYDNASNMAGKYSGLQARLKADNSLAEYVPCSAHSLNLVGVNAVESCQLATSYFGFVQALYNFFSGSPHRWDILISKLSEQRDYLTLKSLSGTRWSANANAVKALRKSYTIISETLFEMSENGNENAATKFEAKCLHKKIQSFENALLTVIWDTLLQRINSTSKTLQSVTCSIDSIVPLYESLISFVQNVRTDFGFDKCEKDAAMLVGEISYTKTRKKRIPKAIDDSVCLDVSENLSEREKFVTQTFYVMCDNLILHLNERMKAYHFLERRFSFLFSKNNAPKELSEAIKKFQDIYNEDVDEDFSDEFVQFSEFMPNVSNAVEMLKLIKSLQIQHTYPNTETALRIFLSIPISNCSGERSFSAMKRIKTRLRTSLSCERLSELALLAIENDLTANLQFEDALNSFCSKSRKKILI